ncbi:MAG: NgoFVII family restriction endonuclease, partial [Oscillospiraceae bacterium]|nr:NgoFVII family restriction endonuclease [Oscillospiraceae bacterium]
MLQTGLYEQVINTDLDHELTLTDKLSQTAPIDPAEAAKVLAKYVAEVVERGLENVKDNGGDLGSQVELVNRIVTAIMDQAGAAGLEGLSVAERAEQLLALLDRQNNVLAVNEKAEIVRPETSIARSSLFTGAVHEPQMYTELKKEIVSCNRIDMLVSFVKWSGLRLLMDELTQFTQNGGELRIITTSYMGATDVKAVEELRKLPNTKIKVSYDTKTTRLHAKAYIFYRDTGFTTAYVGSSNLS